MDNLADHESSRFELTAADNFFVLLLRRDTSEYIYIYVIVHSVHAFLMPILFSWRFFLSCFYLFLSLFFESFVECCKFSMCLFFLPLFFDVVRVIFCWESSMFGFYRRICIIDMLRWRRLFSVPPLSPKRVTRVTDLASMAHPFLIGAEINSLSFWRILDVEILVNFKVNRRSVI